MRHWLFRTTPAVYDIRRRLGASDPMLPWLVRQHKDKIGVGDLGFLWVGGTLDSQAIVGAVRVAGLPSVFSVPETDLAYWPTPSPEPAARVLCEIVNRGPEVKWQEIMEMPEMIDHVSLRTSRLINYELSDRQGRAVGSRIGL